MTRHAAHRFAVGVAWIPVGGGSRVQEFSAGPRAQRDQLDRPDGHDVVGEDEPVDAARDAFEKGHDANAVAPLAEETQRLREIRLGANPANQMSTAMESFAGITGPNGARSAIHPIGGAADRTNGQRRDDGWRPRDANPIP